MTSKILRHVYPKLFVFEEWSGRFSLNKALKIVVATKISTLCTISSIFKRWD